MSKVPYGLKPLHISGTQLRECLMMGKDIPEWFSFPEVIKILRKGTKPLYKRGFCVQFLDTYCLMKIPKIMIITISVYHVI